MKTDEWHDMAKGYLYDIGTDGGDQGFQEFRFLEFTQESKGESSDELIRMHQIQSQRITKVKVSR